jgi:NNP family nitrate/nitrite transporter-like MFS transporter
MFALSMVDSYWGFVLCSLGFGFSGVSFAIGIAFTSLWFSKEKQGTALGIFGAGNAGAAITTLVGPKLLNYLTNNGQDIDSWRIFPIIYGLVLLITGILFFLFTENKKTESSKKTIKMQLEPLKSVRVWRFGMYYFLVFGCFVAFAGWLVPYYTNVYKMDLVTAGILVSCFSLPSGIIRALGGWMSDKWGARRVMYWVLGSSVLISAVLIVPQMDIFTSGKGISATAKGTVTEVTVDYVQVDDKKYPIQKKNIQSENFYKANLFFPAKEYWQEANVKKGDSVLKKQLLVKGVSHIYFQANVWIFTFLTIVIGIIWGIGKAAVYKHIPDYFPNEVGVVGGMVGVIGGLGGFCCPILFGYLLEWSGLWTSCWFFVGIVSVISLIWMHKTIQSMARKRVPEFANVFEDNK